MRLRPLALGAILGVMAGSSAMAQAMPNIEAKRQTDIGLRLAVFHDSNISRSNPVVAASRGIRQEDYTYRPQATFSLVQPIGRQALFLQGAAGYDFHQYNSKLDKRRVNVTGGGIATLGICKVALTGAYSASQSELDELDGTVGQNLQETTTESGVVACGRQRGFNAQFAGNHQDVSNSAARQQTADHTSDSGTVALGYGNQTLGKAGVMFAYAVQDFPNRLSARGSVGDGYLTRTLGVNYEKNFGSKLKIAGGVGATMVKRDSSPVGVPLKFTSTSYTGLISYAVSKRLSLTADTSKSVTPSNRAGKLYDIATTTDVLANYKLGTSFTLSGGGRIADTNSNVDTTVPGPVVTNARDKAIFASIRYRQSEHASVAFDVRQEHRKTNLPTFDYSNTHFGLTLDVSF